MKNSLLEADFQQSMKFYILKNKLPYSILWNSWDIRIITSSGLHPNSKQAATVQDFPRPQTVHQLR